MLELRNLGDSANTTALDAFAIEDLEDVYVTVDGTFSATATVEISFDDGTTWDAFSSGTGAKQLVGPLPAGVGLVRGKNSARASGTVKYRLGGNVKRYLVDSRRTSRGGKFEDLGSATATTAATTAGLSPVEVWLSSADFVGTYTVEISYDNGTTWGIHTTTVVASGATNTKVTLPRCTAARVTASVYTSGTLKSRWAGYNEPQL